MELIIFHFVVARSITVDGNLLQPTGSVNRTPLHVITFSCLPAHVTMSHTTLAQGVSARHTIQVSCACVFVLTSTLSLHSSFVSPILYFILFIFHFIFDVDQFGAKPLCASPIEESGPLANNAPLTDFSGDLEDSKSTSGGPLCISGSHTVVQFDGLVRNKLQIHTVQQNRESSLWTLD